METKNSLRASALRNCKLEGIELPLSEGSLDNIPIGEEALMDNRMDIDDSVGASQAIPDTNDFGIVVDFSSLNKKLLEVCIQTGILMHFI